MNPTKNNTTIYSNQKVAVLGEPPTNFVVSSVNFPGEGVQQSFDKIFAEDLQKLNNEQRQVAQKLLEQYNDPKSRIRNHQELLLRKLDRFPTPEQADALRRENTVLKESVLTLQKDIHRSTQQLWSAKKEKDTLLMEVKGLKTENENLKEKMEELKLKIIRKEEEILQTEYSLEGEKEVNKNSKRT